MTNANINFDVLSDKVILRNFEGGSFAQILGKLTEVHRHPLCLVVEDRRQAESLKEELKFFTTSTAIRIYRPLDIRPYYGLSPHRKILLENLKTLYHLIEGKVQVLIVPRQGLFRRLPPLEIFKKLKEKVAVKDLIERDELAKRLVLMGYERSSVVEDPGQFAVRGDLLDIYSPQMRMPIRLSLFDIEVESIKEFDPVSQRTKDDVSEIDIYPCQEVLLQCYSKKAHVEPNDNDAWIDLINQNWESDLKARADECDIPKQKRDQVDEFIHNLIYFHGIEFFLPLFYKKTSTLFDFMSSKTHFVLDLDNSLGSISDKFLEEMGRHQEESDHIESIFKPHEIYLNSEDLKDQLALRKVIYRDQVFPDAGQAEEFEVIEGKTESNLNLKTQLKAKISQLHSLAPLASELNQKRLDGYRCFIVCQNLVQQERVEDLLKRFDLPIRVIDESSHADFLQGVYKNAEADRLVSLVVGRLHNGFISSKDYQWWISDEEIFGKKTRRVSSKRNKSSSKVFSSFSDISEGDYLIHMDHGIGLYRGLVKLEYDPHHNDFLLLEYLGGDKLYVPVNSLNRVQRFMAEEGAVPQLDKLGGQTWLKTRNKAKKAALKLAKQLLELQAKRKVQKGYIFQSHIEEMEEFASRFEFEETRDQLHAIEDVVGDMMSQRPMDRLICGDVGYGKTEVAIRAAYKSVLDGKQVAVLVPTTVLSFQHYKTFQQRFKDYPVRVELLSRFRSAKEQKLVLADLKLGKVDVVVGTHRLLSKDVKFDDLGLLVVDEEHRFGVVHKEKIKKMRALVDIMTLTATPIPRTLNFALNGIRDLSIINTPPVDRLSVRTFTCYFDEVTVKDALLKELRRGGQAYFVHNRVQSIEKITKQISNLVPEARVRFAHGQMEEGQLEEIMLAFMNHEFDVLVCTTIIESGLDIPNANTMIINRADHMGLAQLYQLRGRVGRSSHQAYCYLIIPQENLMTQKARKRLAVIQKFTELGSGFKVASHDLEIRGAGNILGDEQSGHIAAIGYDLYLQMLNQAIQEVQNNHIPEDFEPEIQLNVPSHIPEDFIHDKQLRLVLYKELSSSENFEEVEDLREEWIDRFGKLPPSVENLISIIRVRLHCHETLISQIKSSGSKIFITFHEQHQIDPDILVNLIQKDSKVYSLTRDSRFCVTKKFEDAAELFEFLNGLFFELKRANSQ